MSADYPTTQDIINMALRHLGQMSAAETVPAPEDTALALQAFNQLVGQKNNRRRVTATFQRSQAFTFTSSLASYTIGTAANSANFVLAAGERPNKLEYAQLVLTGSTPYQFIPLEIINVEQEVLIAQPGLSSQFPQIIYYKPTWPNGTIIPYPAFPTQTSYQLTLTWWNQLLRIALADINSAIDAPNGYDSWLSLKLAVRLYLSFPKRSDLQELKEQCREAESDISSLNSPPKKISTTDGVTNSRPSGWDWRSRSFT